MKKAKTFYCFSPIVMLATFLLEFSLLAYVIIKYKLGSTVRIVAFLLLNLGVFQLAEFMICSKDGSFLPWSKLGYVAITLLPPLGLHLAHKILRRKNNYMIWAAYASALIFSLIFVLFSSFESFACQSNYAIFNLAYPLSYAYSAYYYTWLLIGLFVCLGNIAKTKANSKKAITWLGAGYLVFLVPTGIVNLLSPETIDGIPSIMCGFALLFALILTFKILPLLKVQKRNLA